LATVEACGRSSTEIASSVSRPGITIRLPPKRGYVPIPRWEWVLPKAAAYIPEPCRTLWSACRQANETCTSAGCSWGNVRIVSQQGGSGPGPQVWGCNLDALRMRRGQGHVANPKAPTLSDGGLFARNPRVLRSVALHWWAGTSSNSRARAPRVADYDPATVPPTTYIRTKLQTRSQRLARWFRSLGIHGRWKSKKRGNVFFAWYAG